MMKREQLEQVYIDNEIRESFKRYLSDFNLTVEDLKDKAILDIGSGMIPGFVEYLLQNNITNKVYAVDRWPFGHDLEIVTTDGDLKYAELYPLKEAQKLQSKKHYIQAQGQKLPFNKDTKFDFIFMRASLNDLEEIPDRIEEAAAYLKNGGELRIAPIWQEKPNLKKYYEVIEKLDKNLFNIEWKENVVRRENVEYNPLLLIIKKK